MSRTAMSRTAKIVAAALALALSTALASAGQSSNKRHNVDRDRDREHIERDRHGDRIYARPDANGWYPHDSNKLKIGTQIWWDQMRRDGRLGRPNW